MTHRYTLPLFTFFPPVIHFVIDISLYPVCLWNLYHPPSYNWYKYKTTSTKHGYHKNIFWLIRLINERRKKIVSKKLSLFYASDYTTFLKTRTEYRDEVIDIFFCTIQRCSLKWSSKIRYKFRIKKPSSGTCLNINQESKTLFHTLCSNYIQLRYNDNNVLTSEENKVNFPFNEKRVDPFTNIFVLLCWFVLFFNEEMDIK